MASAKKPRDEAPPPSPATLSEAAGVSKGPPLTPSAPAAEEAKPAPTITIVDSFPDGEFAAGQVKVSLGPQVRRYRVWSHGTLHRDGVVYKPGEELDLREDVAKDICCLELVT